MSSDLATIGALKRLSDLMAGQDFWNVNITGGTISGVTIDDATINGVTPRTVFVMAEDYGVAANDGVDHSTHLQSAHDASISAGKPLLLPSGTILGAFDYDTKARIVGLGAEITTLKLPNGAERDVLRARNANSLFSTSSTSGSHDVELLDFQIDGNRDNNTTGCGIAHYGAAPRFVGLRIKNAPEHGMRTDWYDSERTFAFEGFYHDIRIDSSGKHGWWHEGPHDSHASDIVIIDSSKSAHNTYNHLHHVGAASTRFSRVHCWVRSTATNLPSNALYEATDNGGSEFSNCHFEGAVTAATIVSPNNHFDGLYCYAASGGKTFQVLGSNNKGSIRLGNKRAGGSDVVGITIGDATHSPQGLDFTVTFINQMAGLVDWTHSGGFNAIRGASYANPTVATSVGTPKATDYVWISKWGGSDYGVYQTVTASPVDQASVRIGDGALSLLTNTDASCVAIGDHALGLNVTGTLNTAVGSGALRWATGSQNSGFGASCLTSLTTGQLNTAIGVYTLSALQTGNYNTACGHNALAHATGDGGTAFGFGALQYQTTGAGNAAFGVNAANALVTAGQTTAIGNNALENATAGVNTAVGFNAMNATTSGTLNVAVGTYTLQDNLTGSYNTALGVQALENADADNNTGVGMKAFNLVVDGQNNTGIGSLVGQRIVSGDGNVLFGYNSGSQITSGNYNVVIGQSVGSTTLQTGSNNILIGTGAGVDTPTASTSNYLNIGNAITATGLGTSPVFTFSGSIQSPSLTGTPTATTQSAGDNSTKVATTAYVDRGSSGASRVLIGTQTASNSANITFTGIPATYDEYVLVFAGVSPATNGTSLALNFSSNNGSSWIASQYSTAAQYVRDNATSGIGSNSSDSSINVTVGTVSNLSSGAIHGEMKIFGISDGTTETRVTGQFAAHDGSQRVHVSMMGAWYGGNAVMNALKIQAASGNILRGTFSLYGIRKS